MKPKLFKPGMLLLLAGVLAPVAAESADSLTRRIDDLDQRLRVVSRLSEITQEDAKAAAAKQGKVIAGPGGFSLESGDGAYNLRVGGFLQGIAFGYPQDNNAFTDQGVVRRARIDLRANLGPHLDVRLHQDFAGSALTLLDAYANFKVAPAFSVQVGKFKPPVGLERLQSVSRLLFPEFSLPTSLVPNRDIGVQVHGKFAGDALEYQAGVFQGTVDGGSSEGDNTDDKDLAGRIFIRPFANGGAETFRHLGIGLAGTYGNRLTAPAGFRTQGRNRFFAFRGSDTADGTQVRFTPQGYYYLGPLSVLGEYVVSRQELRAGSAAVQTIEASAWQVQAGYVLTGETSAWGGVKPSRPLDIRKGQYGAWQIAGRVHGLKVDDAAFPTHANPASAAGEILAYTAGVNWIADRNLRVLLNYELSTFTGGAAGGADRDDEHAAIASVNIAF